MTKLPHNLARADKSEGGWGLLMDWFERSLPTWLETLIEQSCQHLLAFFSGMACSPPFSTYSLDLHNQLVTAHSPKNWKTQYVYIHLLFFHTHREPAIGFSLAICHLLLTYLQFIPLPPTSSSLGTVFSSYPLP